MNTKHNSQVSIQPAASNNWETYRNNEYGFIIKYPDNAELYFKYKREDGASVMIFHSDYVENKTTLGIHIYYAGNLLPNQTVTDFERAKRNPEMHKNWPKGFQPKYVEKEVLINGKKMTAWIDLYEGGSAYPGNTVVVPFENNGRIFEISTLVSKDETQMPDFFNQIINTFKFTK